ncbi:hypothetical protein [Bacillus sp. B15-48]|uniref:hypothetical protein n=1 Tax=Bacillus sp. B15-48 TaxID=1548601 RepID=UPI0019401EFE|nr:hypothetical protein [Bacillus sp. B15-48]MBM4761318.1 hypothetical protein [Bacillus sp. B15-48]
MREFFSTKIGHQTIALIVTVVSFPFLYLGGSQHIPSLLNFGIILMLLGMLAVPVLSYVHGKKITKEEVKKEVEKEVKREVEKEVS